MVQRPLESAGMHATAVLRRVRAHARQVSLSSYAVEPATATGGMVNSAVGSSEPRPGVNSRVSPRQGPTAAHVQGVLEEEA
jgi:hypothetical protein